VHADVRRRAERVPVSKPPAIFGPPKAGWARFTWLSMPPGMTNSLARGPIEPILHG
jgi:hypothetical protein